MGPKGLTDAFKQRFPDFEVAPDLGTRIGTLAWYRGAATCMGLCAITLLLSPGFEKPIFGHVPPALAGADWEAAKAQAIAPLEKGGATGHRLAATELVSPLADTPERPVINVSTRLASGDGLLGVLQRSGVGGGDADQAVALIRRALELGQIQPGTPLDITLGRRTDKAQPRPLVNLAFRARFDLKLEVSRGDGALSLKQIPIAIDNTPLRIQGEVGSSLYRSARAAGAPAKAVEAYIRSIAPRAPVAKLGSGCKFDIIVEQARAETGEIKLGNLLYAGVTGCSSNVQLVRMTVNGRDEWFDASGRGERRGNMAMPANGRISSGFGARRHPILGYVRMHKGMDVAAAYGSPVYAATDGVIVFAGRNSGYGNFIKVSHANGYATGYAHLSRIAVRYGMRVSRGQVIGYVGSSGLSTGPHLHYELYKNGVAINPASISFSTQSQLSAGDMAALKARLARLMAVPAGRGPEPAKLED
ncbi:M23 family metallopeptidase [Sphingomonas canadensis]|uniref:M23 family metallopeptidase n=1 Tax=Sphingomonas canadensis TaxID=1219257 RepID=A0ABW3H472_9SPHN|nr:M23 family metallopeptidase [Sphingomonas canadensis]MCW3835147.1 M23 family metallopeptidase [Sphingomonas canadensis]